MTWPLARAERVGAQHVAAIGSLEYIRRLDRRATLEHLVAYVAHHLGTPLNVIEGRAAMMAVGDVGQEDVKRNARILTEQAARMSRFLREIVTFARRDPVSGTSDDVTRETTVDLHVVARAAAHLLRPAAGAKHARISFEGAERPRSVRGNEKGLLVALTHLLENGILATPSGGTVTVRVLREHVPDGVRGPTGTLPYVGIEVEDEGPGIPAEVLPRLFRPFTTSRDGLGLGLFVAQAIARDHGGWVEAANKRDRGARFTLHLPEVAVDAP